MSKISKLHQSLTPHKAIKRTYDRITSDNLSTGDKVKTMLDPQQVFFKDIPLTDKEQVRADIKAERDRRKKKKKKIGYAKGGKVTCRGMGSATRGGRFRKDG